LVTKTQAQLIRSIEQQLENLMTLDEDLEYQYECELYYDNDEPIVEQFSREVISTLADVKLSCASLISGT